ncbi:hypothetical protein BGZ95_008107 [Linnemannia exigua]|uniref:NAD(P)-binding domain-containing protein n=1 Tax=Linnemannia exigua TaxID=604196 RepID=A0AAD4CZP6_9FUNG|nr:hypothetical protein BGZ95_008107 [Linnemannia exigua]
MTTSTATQFIAFFGATGGCTNACLVHTLKAGFFATALARTPSKLTDMLLAQGLEKSIIDTQLTIVKGDIADLLAIKSVLTNNNTFESTAADSVQIASQIISGIGGTPQMRMSLSKPMTIDNPEICATTTKNIIQALQEIYSAHPSTTQHKPSIAVISTTGVSDVREDVPFGFRTFYHVGLAVPHRDKKEMERLVSENASSTGVFRGAVIVRPSLLKGDQSVKSGKGWQKLKVGKEDKPAVGFTVHRADVGQWICEQVVKTGGESYFGQKVTLTN